MLNYDKAVADIPEGYMGDDLRIGDCGYMLLAVAPGLPPLFYKTEWKELILVEDSGETIRPPLLPEV